MSTQLVVARIAGLVGRSSELRQLLADRAAAARSEPGCLSYDVAELLEQPAAFLVVHAWRSAEDLRRHFGSDAHAAYQHAVDELLARPTDVTIHEVASTVRPAPSTSATDPGRFG
jgi:quinol monooxygenase YgiN